MNMYERQNNSISHMIPLHGSYLLPPHCKRRFKRDSKAGLRFIHGLYGSEGGLVRLENYTMSDTSIWNSKHSYPIQFTYYTN